MSNAKISVVIPVYRVSEGDLRACLKSVTDQSFKEIEIILVDDGASPETAAILDEYAGNDDRITVIHQENHGVSAARNTGLELCNGKYVTFVDSDDYLDLSCLETVYGQAEKMQLELLMWGTYKLYPKETVTYAPYVDDIPLLNSKQKEQLQLKTMVGSLPVYEYPCSKYGSGSCCSKLYLRSFLNEHNLRYPEGIRRAEDVNFNIRAFEAAERIGYLNRHMDYYRQLPGSATYQYRENGISVFTDALSELARFLKETHKSDCFMQVYYMRCMFFFLESMEMDYCNPDNPKPYFVRMNEMRRVLETEPYREAFSGLSYDSLTFARKIPLFLIRRKWVGLLAVFFGTYRKIARK